MQKIIIKEVVGRIDASPISVVTLIGKLQQLVQTHGETIHLELDENYYGRDTYNIVKNRPETDIEFEKRCKIEQQRIERLKSDKLKSEVQTFLKDTIQFDPKDESAFKITKFQTDADKVLSHHKDIFSGVTIEHIATGLIATSQKSLDFGTNVKECMRILKELVTIKQLRRAGIL